MFAFIVVEMTEESNQKTTEQVEEQERQEEEEGRLREAVERSLNETSFSQAWMNSTSTIEATVQKLAEVVHQTTSSIAESSRASRLVEPR